MVATNLIDYDAFHWVKSEIEVNLTECRSMLATAAQALDTDAARAQFGDSLRHFADLYHQIYGGLQMIELRSLARLVLETEGLITDYLAGNITRSDSNVLAVIQASEHTLTDALRRVAPGARKNPIEVVELVTQVRAARNLNAVEISSLISPITDVFPKPTAPRVLPDEDYKKHYNYLRKHFQLRLLIWLRDNQHEALEAMRVVAKKLLSLSTFRVVTRLWWVTIAYIDFLSGNEIRNRAVHGRILREIDDILRKLARQGEPALIRDSADELIKTMVFYVGVGRIRTPHMDEVAKVLSLAQNFLELDESSIRTNLDSLDHELKQYASDRAFNIAEIRRRIGDYFGDSEDSALPLVELARDFARLAEEFSRADIEVVTPLVQEAYKLMQNLSNGSVESSDDVGFHLASATLFIETSVRGNERLDDAWVRNGQRKLAVLKAINNLEELPRYSLKNTLMKGERQALLEVVRFEIDQNLRSIESRLEEFSQHAEKISLLAGIDGKIRHVRGALQVLGEHRVGLLLQMAEEQFAGLENGDAEPSRELSDALATAVVVMDEYVLGLQRGDHNMDEMLDRAITEMVLASGGQVSRADVEKLLEQYSASLFRWLDKRPDFPLFNSLKSNLCDLRTLAKKTGLQDVEELVKEQNRLIDVISQEPAFLVDSISANLQNNMATISAELVKPYGTEDEAIQAVDLPRESPDIASPVEPDEPKIYDLMESWDVVEESPDLEQPQISESEQANAAVIKQQDDPIFKVFLAESENVLSQAQDLQNACQNEPDNRVLLRDLRCAFHTLKGSARMVGLEAVGELAWLCESLFNYVLDTKKLLTPSILEFSSHVLEQLQHQRDAEYQQQHMIDVADWVARTEQVELQSTPPLLAESQADSSWQSMLDDEHSASHYESRAPLYEESSDLEMTATPDEAQPEEGQSYQDEAAERVAAIFADVGSIDDLHDSEPKSRETESEESDRDDLNEIEWSLATIESSENTDLENAPQASSLNATEPFDLSDKRISLLPEDLTDLLEEDRLTLDALDQKQPDPENESDSRSTRRSLLPDDLIDLIDSELQNFDSAVADSQKNENEEDHPHRADRYSDDRPIEDEESLETELKAVFGAEMASIRNEFDGEVAKLTEFTAAPATLANIMRQLHTVKGSALTAGAQNLGELTHQIEGYLEGVYIREQDDLDEVRKTLEMYSDELGRALQALQSGREFEVSTVLSERIQPSKPNTLKSRADQFDAAQSDKTGSQIHSELEVQNELASFDDSEVVADNTEASSENVPDVTEQLHELDQQQQDAQARAAALRIQVETLDSLTNFVGDASMNRSQMRDEVKRVKQNVDSLYENLRRFTQQVRDLEIEADGRIASRSKEQLATERNDEFDPLEMDQYSKLQRLSRGLTENLDELNNIQTALSQFVHRAESSLQKQDRLNRDLQDEILRVRLVTFGGIAPQLRQVVRSTAQQVKKQVDLQIIGSDVKLDKAVLDGIFPALEHMLRNAIDHGIEAPEKRQQAGKPVIGKIVVECQQVGREIVIHLSDDGAGLDVEKIRARAIQSGLAQQDQPLTPSDVLMVLSQAGFSTAKELTRISGRGIGMDVVQSTLRKLGGSLIYNPEQDKPGTRFTLRLPTSLAVSSAVLIHSGGEQYAVPARSVGRVISLPATELASALDAVSPQLKFDGQDYMLIDLASYLGFPPTVSASSGKLPVILVNAGVQNIAVVVDEFGDIQEIVIKNLGDHLGRIPIYAGATIRADGEVVLVVDLVGISYYESVVASSDKLEAKLEEAPSVMVVDDSLMVRKSAQRDLQGLGIHVILAKDGIHAQEQLEGNRPEMILLDIGMPRMDGFEFLQWLKNNEQFSDIPVIVISSRDSEKHIEKATQLGSQAFLSKPYMLQSLVKLCNQNLPLAMPIEL